MFLRVGRHRISLRLIIAVVLGMAAVAVGLTALVMLGGKSADTEVRGETVEPASGMYDWIDADELVVPDELRLNPSWVPYRARRERWDDAEAAQHWIDPQEIGVDVLADQVETRVLEILEDVP